MGLLERIPRKHPFSIRVHFFILNLVLVKLKGVGPLINGDAGLMLSQCTGSLIAREKFLKVYEFPTVDFLQYRNLNGRGQERI